MAADPAFALDTAAVASAIHTVRGRRVMLDADLAALYEVETRALNQAVRRNGARFPADFAFQLTLAEAARLRSQPVIANGRGGSRNPPWAFTEQGVAMLASVLRSPRAVEASIAVMRTFVQLRGLLASHAELAARLDALEGRYDGQFEAVFEAIRALMAPPPAPARRLGFQVEE